MPDRICCLARVKSKYKYTVRCGSVLPSIYKVCVYVVCVHRTHRGSGYSGPSFKRRVVCTRSTYATNYVGDFPSTIHLVLPFPFPIYQKGRLSYGIVLPLRSFRSPGLLNGRQSFVRSYHRTTHCLVSVQLFACRLRSRI